MPDLFSGGAVTEADLTSPSRGPAWLLSECFPTSPQQQTAEKLETAARALKELGRAATVHSAGHCYGTIGVLHLYQKGLATTGVIAHPTGFDNSNASQCTQPTLFNCAETNVRFSVELRQHWQHTLAANNVPAEFVVYPGTQHGFAVRDDGSAVGVAARQRAIEETIAWLKQHVTA